MDTRREIHNWKIEDTNGNSIGFTAPSKTQAVEQYKRMFPMGRIQKVTDQGEVRVPRRVKIPLPGVADKSAFKPVETMRNTTAVPGPNEPCSCGSGKKYKKCCMRKRGPATSAKASR